MGFGSLPYPTNVFKINKYDNCRTNYKSLDTLYKIHLINPAKVPEIANNYKKTDKEDSFQLADVLRKGGMKEIYIPLQNAYLMVKILLQNYGHCKVTKTD